MQQTAFSERLNRLFQEREITQQKAANELGVSRQAVARWLNGTSEPERDKMVALSELLNLPPAYVMFGQEGSFSSVDIDEDTVAIPVLDVCGKCSPGGYVNGIAKMIKLIRVTKAWLSARCTAPNWRSLHIITASGDSMSPLLEDGDFVIIDASKKTIYGDGVYVVQSDDATLIKRVQVQLDGSLLLLSDNPLYKPFTIPKEDRDRVRIIGKCVIGFNAKEI